MSTPDQVKSELRRLAMRDYGSFVAYILKYTPAIKVRPTNYGNDMRVTITAQVNGTKFSESTDLRGHLSGGSSNSLRGLIVSAERWQEMNDATPEQIKEEMRLQAAKDYGSFIAYTMKYTPDVSVRPVNFGNDMRVTIGAKVNGVNHTKSIDLPGYLSGKSRVSLGGFLDTAEDWQNQIEPHVPERSSGSEVDEHPDPEGMDDRDDYAMM